MPYEIDLLTNPTHLALKRQVVAGEYDPVNIGPSQSPTLEQLSDGVFLTTPLSKKLTEELIQNIHR